MISPADNLHHHHPLHVIIRERGAESRVDALHPPLRDVHLLLYTVLDEFAIGESLIFWVRKTLGLRKGMDEGIMLQPQQALHPQHVC